VSIDIRIIDGKGRDRAAIVTSDQELCMIQVPHPPLVSQKTKPFRQFLTADGTASGSNDMGIDGSSVNADFFIDASQTADRYLTRLNFIIGYGLTGQPNEWADGTALTNGSRLFYENQAGEVDIHDSIKTNQDMFRLVSNWVPTGWEVRHVNASNDFGYFIEFNLMTLVPPFGIKLDLGSKNRLTMRIKDNAGTDADSFNCIAYGFDRFK